MDVVRRQEVGVRQDDAGDRETEDVEESISLQSA